jgi:choline dehydrogenase-like flavoprotein
VNERTIPEGEFDYVIVGAGTAGYVLANRLNEERDVSLLALDRRPGQATGRLLPDRSIARNRSFAAARNLMRTTV